VAVAVGVGVTVGTGVPSRKLVAVSGERLVFLLFARPRGHGAKTGLIGTVLEAAYWKGSRNIASFPRKSAAEIISNEPSRSMSANEKGVWGVAIRRKRIGKPGIVEPSA
jgi:hypothetical protein